MEEQPTTGQIGLKYGLIYALASTVVNLIPIVTNTATDVSWILNIVNIIVAFAIFIMAGREYKRGMGGTMGFGEGFKINMIAASIMAVVRTLITFVYTNFIDPEYGERMLRTMEEQFAESGMPQEQIDQTMRMTSLFMDPAVGIAMGIILAILGGLLWGAIAAAITKNEEEEF